jgi:two-component system chemotaxis response regulator CheY
MRRILCDLFVSNGYVVVAMAENGSEATQLYKEVQPALVTIDIEMPIMDGLEATKRIKEYDPEAKVVVVSESLDKPAVLEAVRAGATDYVAKPVQPARLLTAVANILDA